MALVQQEKNKKTIKVRVIDFGRGTDLAGEDEFFVPILRQKYNVIICDKPDYLFYSVFGNQHHKYDCIRLFYTGENIVPNFNYCDYAFGFNHISFGDRYMRLPLWRLYHQAFHKVLNRCALKKDQAINRKFCNMVVSNAKQTDGYRETFFEKLNTYKTVDSGGKYKNNVGGPVPDKGAFAEQYKFSFAMENTAVPGYCTEKIIESFAANTIPIYYGDETVTMDFNPKAFINCHDYDTMDAVIDKIKELDENPDLYMAMLNEPIFNEGVLEKYSNEKILAFLSSVVDAPLPKAKRRCLIKHYADVDLVHLKERDVREIIRHYLGRKIRKIWPF